MGRKKKTYPSFRRCVGVYFSFVKQKTGMNPVFDATQGRALKKIIDWLEGNLKENKSDDNIINGFKFILDRHDQWEDFYKNQIKLTQIHSNITNIVKNIRDAHGKSKSEKYKEVHREIQSRVGGAESLKAIQQLNAK